MGKSRRKLFISATISGIALRLGIPGLADLVSLVWDTTRGPIGEIVPSSLHAIVSIAGLLVFAVIMYLTWEIYLEGARKGSKGVITVVAGVVAGLAIGSFLFALLAEAIAA